MMAMLTNTIHRVIFCRHHKIYTYIFKEHTTNLLGDIDDDDDISKHKTDKHQEYLDIYQYMWYNDSII